MPSECNIHYQAHQIHRDAPGVPACAVPCVYAYAWGWGQPFWGGLDLVLFIRSRSIEDRDGSAGPIGPGPSAAHTITQPTRAVPGGHEARKAVGVALTRSARPPSQGRKGSGGNRGACGTYQRADIDDMRHQNLAPLFLAMALAPQRQATRLQRDVREDQSQDDCLGGHARQLQG